jgi:hypothetical protein
MEVSTIPRLLGDRPMDDDTRRSLWDGQFTRFLRREMQLHVDEEGEEWEEEAFVCENPDGTEYAWTNATLVVVPLDGPLAEWP